MICFGAHDYKQLDETLEIIKLISIKGILCSDEAVD